MAFSLKCKQSRSVKISRDTHNALKEISTLTGMKMWAVMELAVMAKLHATKDQSLVGK